MLYKFLITFFVLFISSNAGMIGNAISVVKDKAIDKTKETATDIYKQRKEIRRENEKVTGKESLLSKTENELDKSKGKITKTKKIAKETAIESVGKENIDYLKRGKNQMKDTLIGRPTTR